MDNQDSHNTMETLEVTSKWTMWKTKDKEWSSVPEKPGFQQLLNIHKDKQTEWWGFKIKGWCRRGDIRSTKPKKSFECWVTTTSDIPTGSQESLTSDLLVSHHNVGKDEYTVDLGSNEQLYCLDTESGLLGSFGFEGSCRVGDGSCVPPSRSMGSGFCNFTVMKWNTTEHYPMTSCKNNGL